MANLTQQSLPTPCKQILLQPTKDNRPVGSNVFLNKFNSRVSSSIKKHGGRSEAMRYGSSVCSGLFIDVAHHFRLHQIINMHIEWTSPGWLGAEWTDTIMFEGNRRVPTAGWNLLCHHMMLQSGNFYAHRNHPTASILVSPLKTSAWKEVLLISMGVRDEAHVPQATWVLPRLSFPMAVIPPASLIGSNVNILPSRSPSQNRKSVNDLHFGQLWMGCVETEWQPSAQLWSCVMEY